MFDRRLDGFSTNGHYHRLSRKKWLRVYRVKAQKGLIERENRQSVGSPLEEIMGPPLSLLFNSFQK